MTEITLRQIMIKSEQEARNGNPFAFDIYVMCRDALENMNIKVSRDIRIFNKPVGESLLLDIMNWKNGVPNSKNKLQIIKEMRSEFGLGLDDAVKQLERLSSLV
jgi:hypothetical protein